MRHSISFAKAVIGMAVWVWAAAFAAEAAIPRGYYTPAIGKATSELKTALCSIILPHTEVSSYSALPSYFQRTDIYPESNRWWDMYSDIPFYAPSFKGLNREHSLPKSWWGGMTDIPAYVDINHLYPAESAANMAKSNYPLGVVTGTPTFDNGISLVGRGINSGGAPYVFEPADQYKGDFARTYFYMVTCYQDIKWKYTYMTRTGLYPSLQGWAIDLLLDWHRRDPVSQKEIDRNEQVYLIQNNRNPFIDYPELAELIWGSRMGETFNPDIKQPSGDPLLVSPVQDMSLDFGQVASGHTHISRLYFNGENLYGQFELTVAGADAGQFELSSRSFDANLANSASGYWLALTYRPDKLGSHTARLIVQDGGITGSLGIELRGECLPVPELTAPVATEPTDITSDTYVANWTSAPDEVVDYYVVTRRRYVNGEVTTEELLAEEDYLEIDGFDESDSESYTVQSVRLEIRSAESNAITVTHASVDPTALGEPLVVECYDGFVRFVCGAPHSDVRIHDGAGRLLMTLPLVESNLELSLAPGIYFVTSATHPAPVKILAR